MYEWFPLKENSFLIIFLFPNFQSIMILYLYIFFLLILGLTVSSVGRIEVAA
jgi:hypothetical protein